MPLYPNGLSLLHSVLEKRLKNAAEHGANQLQHKLDQPGHGIHYPENPNPSSTIDEYPAVQSGSLRDSIAAHPSKDHPLTYEIGSFDGPFEALDLIMRPPAQGGRDYITRALHDDEIHESIKSGMRAPINMGGE